MDSQILVVVIPVASSIVTGAVGGAVGWYWKGRDIKIKENHIRIQEKQTELQERHVYIEYFNTWNTYYTNLMDRETDPEKKRELYEEYKKLKDKDQKEIMKYKNFSV